MTTMTNLNPDNNIAYNTARNCRHYAMCKIDFLGGGVISDRKRSS